ncbi:uncharacterized protein LOC136039401 [Artemia franciscana]|uniref:uncharacterized protein LOC136039401 n=1 Tax=Artemia franciscana TaxID=6661 RepID=UPI0032DAD416
MSSSFNDYRLKENERQRLSPVWGIVHISCLSFAAFSSFVGLFLFERLQLIFEGPCFLYADLVFGNITNDTIQLVVSDEQIQGTVWGEMGNCAFFRFMTALQVLSGWLLATMFCCIGPEEYKIFRYSKPWQLICPGVCASGILLLISGLNAATYYGGLRAFCQSITTGLKAQRCSDIRNYIVDAKPKMNVFYFQAFLVEITVFGSFVAWLFTFCSLLLRCCFLPDFETTSISATSLIAQSRPSTAMTRYSISLASGDRTRKNSSTRSRQQSSEIARAELDTTGSFSTDFEGTETAKLASPELSISTSNANGDYEDGIPMQILKNLQN